MQIAIRHNKDRKAELKDPRTRASTQGWAGRTGVWPDEPVTPSTRLCQKGLSLPIQPPRSLLQTIGR